MKKAALILVLTVMVLSCSDDTIKNDHHKLEAKATIDLDHFNYSDVSDLLSQLSGKKKVMIIKDNINYPVLISPSTDSIQGEQLKLFEGNPDDSISLALSPDYVTVIKSINGNQYNYVDYRDSVKMKAIAAYYKRQLPLLRSSEYGSMIRNTGNRGLELNITKLQELCPKKGCAEGYMTKSQYEEIEKERAIQLRSADVRNNIVTVYLLREKGTSAMDHEITWQINKASESIRDVCSRIRFNFIIESCNYAGGDNAKKSLSGFRDWVQTRSKHKNDVRDIFFLVRWGGWDSDILGRSYVDSYSVRSSCNSYAYGISCTTAWYPTVLSHEMGHIFGATHVSSHTDLMYPTNHWFIKNKHKDNHNRAIIKSNCQL